jgi:hypothetical protein
MKTLVKCFPAEFLRLIACSLVLIFITVNSKAQTSFLKDSLRANLSEASKKLYKDYVQNRTDQPTIYLLACSYALQGKKDSAFKYLDVYLNADTTTKLDSRIMPLCEPDLLSLKTDPRWEKLRSVIIGKVTTDNGLRYHLKDLGLAAEMWDMWAVDQAYYEELHIAQRQIGPVSTVANAISHYKELLNKANIERLEKIVSEKGWPKLSAVGRKASLAAFFVIQHSTVEKQKLYVPMIEQLCKIGEADWESFALMTDRIRVYEKKQQVYGSQMIYNNEKKQFQPYPIEDEKNLDKRRAAAGIMPMKEYCSYLNITYTPVSQ